MSFATYNKEASPPPRTDGVDSVLQEAVAALQRYSLQVNDFSARAKLVGTRRDGPQLRAALLAAHEDTEAAGAAVADALAESLRLAATALMLGRQNMTAERVLEEYHVLQASFQAASARFREKTARLPVLLPSDLPPSTGDSPDETTPLVGLQLQTQVYVQDQVDESDLQYHVALTEERNRQIEQISSGIREVNSFFKDLGDLVTQQGAQLDTVEENILQVSGNTQHASRELTKAHEYQRRKTRWCFLAFVALAVVTLVVVLAVVS